MKKISFMIVFLLISAEAMASCTKNDASENMCAGNGYCTYYPMGEENAECGQIWEIPKNWIALDTDCLSNTKSSGKVSCAGKGKISVVICGKSNCYKCICQ